MVSEQPEVIKKYQTYNSNVRKMIKTYDPIYNKWNHGSMQE